MKRIFYPALAVLLTTVACTEKKSQPSVDPKPIDTLVADWDETSIPMPITIVYQLPENFNPYGDGEETEMSLRHVFDSQEDSALYTPIADSYHLFISEGKKTNIKFTGLQPKAKEYGMQISGPYAYCMKGLNYEYSGQESSGFAFNDAFLNTHEILDLKYPENTAPKYLLDTLATRYNNEVRSSYTCATSMDEKFTLYSVQMEPQNGKCLGMRVVVADGTLYIHEEWCEEYNEESAWHVDDGGEYYPFSPLAVTKGEKGYDIFYYEGAPESSTYAALLLRNGKFENYDFSCYYNAIDYTPTPDPTDLPEGSVLTSELNGYKVWIHTDAEPTEDDPMGAYSVYYSKPESDEVFFIVKTCGTLDPVENFNNGYDFVSKDEVMAANEAYIIKDPNWENYYLIIQGCPDARNVYSYVSYLPIGTINPSFRWVRTNEGFQGVDESGKLLKFANYGYYEEGGRYAICKYFDFDFNLVKEEPFEE